MKGFCSTWEDYLSKDLSDKVDIGSRGAQDPAHHLDVGEVLFVHAAKARGAGLSLCQGAGV